MFSKFPRVWSLMAILTLGLLLVNFNTVSVAFGAPSLVSQIGSPASQYGTSTTLSSFTVPAGTNRLLVVVASDTAATDITGVTFDSQSMTEVVERNDGVAVDSVYVLPLGDSGLATTGNIVMTSGSSPLDEKFIGAVAFENVDQADPTDGEVSKDGTGSSTLSITSEDGDLVFDVFDSFLPSGGPATITPGAGQIQLHDASGPVNSSGFAHYGTSTQDGAAAVVSSWTTNANAILHLALNINAAGPVPLVCTAGTYLASPTDTACTDASVGNFVDSNGATSQTACPLGFYQDQTGQTACIPAPIGSYVDMTEASEATNCPAGTTTVGEGSVSVDACFANTLVINEIDYDQPTPPSSDSAEFIEIKNTGSTSINLDGYAVHLINGLTGATYAPHQINLPAVNLAAGDYYVICGDAANVDNCDLDVIKNTNLLQNGSPGPDAVALMFGTSIIDTLSYEGNSPAPYTETAGAPADQGTSGNIDKGLSRITEGGLDGVDTDSNQADFSFRCITPGEANTTDNSNCGAGSITVIKSATPADGTDFLFTMTRPSGPDITATLDDDTDPTRSDNFTASALDAGDYDITEALPAGWQLDSVDCGAGVTTTDITNGVTVSLAQGQDVTCTFNNSEIQQGSITVIKSATPADGTDFLFTMTRPSGPDITATLDDDSDPTRSDNFTASALDAGDYDITEALPAGWQLDSVDCGAGVTTTDITNGVTVSLAQGQDVTCTFNNSQQVVDLSLTKSDGGITAEPGDTVVYTINYENTQGGGPVDTATNVILTETVPPNTTFNATASGGVWSCADGSPGGTTCTQSIGSIAPSASGSTTFAVDVDNPFSATGGIKISNTAVISSDQSDRAPSNNTVIEQTPITAAPELAITKSDGGGSFAAGDTIVYTVGVTNTGNRIAPSVIISETVPAHTSFNQGASSSGWTCSPMGGPAGANCTIQIPLLDNTPQTVLFAVDVDGTLPIGVTSTDNHIDIRSSSQFPESNTADNEFQLTTQLNNRGSITIIKDVIYVADIDVDSGRDFPFFSTEVGNFLLDDPAVDDADGITNTITFASQAPGNYTITENPNGNWIQSVECVGDDNISYIAPGTGATIDLDAGEDVVCTFTNERVTYELTYTKVLSTGTPVPADDWEFTLASLQNLVPGDIDIDFGVVTTVTAAGGSSSLTLPLDAYKVGEVVPLNYDLVQINCGLGGSSTLPPVNDQFTIMLDQNLTCVFTNQTTKAEITLIKNVVNDNGGTAGVNDFGLTIGGTAVNSGDTLLVNANDPVTIDETLVADYDFVSITGHAKCPAALGGNITPAPGEKITCTITNDDKSATIVIIKDSVPDDSQDFEFSISGGLLPATFTLDDDADMTLSNIITFTDVATGTYTVEETSVLGFDVFVSCVDVSGDTTMSGKTATIKAALGETVTCKFTNEKQIPEISIDDVLIVEGTGGTTTMEFTVSRSNNYFNSSVTVNSADGTAVSPADYTPIINELVNFSAGGDLSKVVSVDITTDAIVEADETFLMNLSNGVNGTIIDGQGEGTIINDDKATLKLSGGTSRTETDSGQVKYVFYAILQDPIQGGFSIDIANLDLTATVADNDYEANSDTLTFVGDVDERHTFTILVNGDEKVEADEKFAAQFTSDPDTPLKDDIMITTEVGRFDLDYHTASIYNDDTATLKLSGGTSVEETDSGQVKYVFTATLFDAIQGGFNIDYANLDMTAKVADNDYDSVSGTLSFAGTAGEQHTVTVYVNGDEKVEADETFALTFTSDPRTTLVDDIEITGAPGKLQKFHEATIFNDDKAVVTLSGPIEKTEGDSGTTRYTFMAKLFAEVDGGFDLPYSTDDGSAELSDGDYIDNDDTLRFSGSNGESHTITVDVKGDTVGEAHEFFYVTLGEATPDTAGITIITANSPRKGVILNDDAGVLFLNVGDGEVNEDAGTLSVDVELSNVKGVAVTVDFAVTAGTATAGSDFTPQSGSLSFAAGELSKVIEIPILDDSWAEASESIVITLSGAAGAELGNPSSAEVTIVDDDAAPVVSLDATEISVSESATSAVVRLSLSSPSQASVTVKLMTADGSATGGSDYTSADQTVTFEPGETTATAMIAILADTLYERDETLELMLAEPVNAELADAVAAVLTIKEDDAAPTVSISDVSMTEPAAGEQALSFELKLSAISAVDITVKFATEDGTAEDGIDYLSNSGTLIIPAGGTKGTISVIVLGDDLDEGDETFNLRLFDLSDGELDGVAAAGTVTGTITQNTTMNVIYLPVINR